ncbi:glutaminyl-tRNA synthetase [Catalinimonas alkaloidigena]|uniref:Glutamine--tRNA ligase n=1 Tax=Catalinimonas alkaloidigena TaxID=1075417 RepID=A0A1G9ILI6_9BACT|nr:glutamine--tRNA ligase/YqeY domain fusion protein [Catalinimonas alkaloidigena]SDL26159.1 glutaminyl-tRNA synthetase [Catalinimonas alkaloidigena]
MSDVKESLNFIEQIIEKDEETGKFGGRVHTRFPPEPNGFLHIGHAKSICLNFGLARDYNGRCNLRFDDTNPVTEKVDYVQAIEEDVRWLGFEWAGKFFASDYFEQLYQYALQLIKSGDAFVCDLTLEEIAERRGTPTEPGQESPYRNRSVEENLDLFQRMRHGEFSDGSKTLRAKIDMASPNMHMRDPVLYRIRKAHHHRTGDQWPIYPMYDYAHGLSDSIEGITHSVCTLEFEVHRPLYDWIIDRLGIYHPQQIEFARLNLNYTIMSKRRLLELVEGGYVHGWDDPRLPTIRGLRRRGYTPEAIRKFAERVGVAKRDNIIDVALLEFTIREDLNKRAARRLAVLDPLKVVITNYPEGQTEQMEATNNPEDPEAGTRSVPFSRELYIEREDFMEDPPKKFFRLAPGREVRLKYAYIIRCDDVVKNENGEIVELRCTYDPDSRSGQDTTGKKVKATLHWLSAPHAVAAEIRLYDRLVTVEDPAGEKERDWKEFLNPDSLVVLPNAVVEPSLGEVETGALFQFERKGYFCVDPDTTTHHKPVFNRTVTLKDDWAKQQQKG